MNAIVLYRVERWFYIHRMKLISKIIQGMIFLIYNTKIPPDCEIGRGTFLVCKGIGVVVIHGAVIGNNCTLGIGCRIVRKMPYSNVAKIGDNVFIGPGAVISGPVKIGNNVIIAPNSVVTKSIPAGFIVGGIPAKKIGLVKNLDYNILENPKYKDGWADELE